MLSVELSRDVFRAGCQHIANALAPDGFTYARSRLALTRRAKFFSFQITFQSSRYNNPGRHVALWIHANVRSKCLAAWLAAQPHRLRSGDAVAGGQIGNLVPSTSWMEWNLADPGSRAVVLSEAVATIRRIALPYFTQFDDVPQLCERLLGEEIPSMAMPLPIEFLLCFSDRARAEACLHRFLAARPELLGSYFRELARFRRDGVPPASSTSYATELAMATIAYELTAPRAA